MGEKRVKTFHDITARRWNDIINAVNSRRPADSIYPPLEEHELEEFRKMEAQKAEADRDGGCPLIFDNVEYDFDDPELDIYSTPVSSDINYSDMDRQDLPLKLHEAIRFAEEKHRAQKRKGTDIAYIIHPMEVLQILMGERCSIEVAIAGILHDVLEDTDADADEIRARFGEYVLSLVQAHTEKKNEEGQKRPWRIRKEEDLERMRASGFEVKQIVMADSISNLRSMVYDYRAVGDELWERFNASRDDIAWYYNEKIDAFEELQYNENTRDDYWELNSLFKHLFVDYYVIEDTAIYQQFGSEIHMLLHDGDMLWKKTDAIPENAMPASKSDAEHLEDYWRFQAEVQDRSITFYSENPERLMKS
ncbi:MAG: HD domain-containing protein [Firmicutes bacterium]|nr:HD domain-containing protein [Bacillota bacterium]